MNKLKKVLKIQLFSLPILPIFAWILILSINGIQDSGYKEISLNDFIEKIIMHRIEFVTINEDRYEVEIDQTGEKYFHIFSTDEEKATLEKKAKFANGYPSYVIKHSKGIVVNMVSLTAYLLLFIIVLNILIMWLITMFDLLRSDFENLNNKWIWMVCFLLMPFVAPFYYIYISEKQKINSVSA